MMISSSSENLRAYGGPSEKFETLRNDLLQRNQLFTDTSFPPQESSLYSSKKPPYKIVWMRPKDIVAANTAFDNATPTRINYPEFIAPGGIDLGSIRQGELGDCWVVAALASLNTNLQLLNRSIPVGQNFESNWYAGIFCFRFWNFGKWKEVIIDDWLPVRSDGRPLFVHSAKLFEFWPCLLEKAYAKLQGSYEVLNSLLIGDAMNDIIGGLTESYLLNASKEQGVKYPPDLDDILIKSFDRYSCIITRIKTSGYPSDSFVLPTGFVPGQVFSLTDCRKLKLTDLSGIKMVKLVRVRNLWNVAQVNWIGAWSETSPEWISLTPEDRDRVGLIKNENEFWMTMEDFCDNFEYLDICHITENAPIEEMMENLGKFPLSYVSFGRWHRGVSTGGRPFIQSSHWANPQYRLELQNPDVGDSDGLCTLVIGLMQIIEKRSTFLTPPKYHSIGFVIYKINEDSVTRVDRNYFTTNTHCASVDYFFDSREVVKRFRLPPGIYLLVPCTYLADQAGEFLLRIIFNQNDRSIINLFQNLELSSFAVDGPGQDTSYDIISNRIRRLYYEISGDMMAVDAFQLTTIFDTILHEDGRNPYNHINIDACRALVSLMDRNNSGLLMEKDFRKMWSILRYWTKSFGIYDPNRTHKVTSLDFRNILENSGYLIPHSTLAKLVRRFIDIDWCLDYSKYIQCMAIITKSIALFSQFENDSIGNIKISLEDFVDSTLTL